MGYFDDCRPDERFTSGSKSYCNDSLWVIYDWDKRRTITVSTLWEEDDEDFIFKILAEHVDDLVVDAVLIQVSGDGALLSCSSDIGDDQTMIPFYPSVADFPRELRRAHRSDLTEIDRLGVQADLTTWESLPGQIKRVAFKYHPNQVHISISWHEVNCLICILKHPNIVPFYCLVVDTVDSDKVVGFTTNFISGGTVFLDNVSRLFKLKYLKQLIEDRHLVPKGDITYWLTVNHRTGRRLPQL